jgi:glycosyltransferase involved in cell wall biosynthesis
VAEGLGTSLLDAMACGKPIVATEAGGIPEVVQNGVTGWLVPPRDHPAMADAIVGLLNDPALCRRMGEASRITARERFSVERMVLDTLRVYQRVALHPHHDDTSTSVSAGPPSSRRGTRSGHES